MVRVLHISRRTGIEDTKSCSSTKRLDSAEVQQRVAESCHASPATPQLKTLRLVFHLAENLVDDLAHIARLDRVRLDHAARAAVESGRGPSPFPDVGAGKEGSERRVRKSFTSRFKSPCIWKHLLKTPTTTKNISYQLLTPIFFHEAHSRFAHPLDTGPPGAKRFSRSAPCCSELQCQTPSNREANLLHAFRPKNGHFRQEDAGGKSVALSARPNDAPSRHAKTSKTPLFQKPNNEISPPPYPTKPQATHKSTTRQHTTYSAAYRRQTNDTPTALEAWYTPLPPSCARRGLGRRTEPPPLLGKTPPRRLLPRLPGARRTSRRLGRWQVPLGPAKRNQPIIDGMT